MQKLYNEALNGKMNRRKFLKLTGAAGLAFVTGCTNYLPKRSPPAQPKDPVIKYLEDNEKLSYGFSKADYDWGKNYVEDNGKEFFDSQPELHETLNAKIKQERFVLEEKLGQSYGSVNNLINKNWKYHYDLWKNGKSLLPLDEAGMTEMFPDREDKDIIYRGMWMDHQVTWMDALTGKWNLEKSIPVPKMEILERNMNAISDGTLYKRVMDAYEKPDSKLHKEAWWIYNRNMQTALAGFGGWHKTTEYFRPYDEEFAKDERLNKLRFLVGFMSWTGAPEGSPGQAIPYLSNVYSKAFGDYLSVIMARYPDGRGQHVEPAYAIPIEMIEKFKGNPSKYKTPIIGKGQAISFYSTVEGLKEDGSKYLEQMLPNGEIITLFTL